MPKQNPNSPKTVLGKARVVLDAFTAERPSLTLTEIIQACQLSKPTVFRLLQELTELGFLSQQGKRYQLGVVSYRLGLIAKQQLGLDDILHSLLTPLADATGETIITAQLDRDQVLYVHVIESESPLRFVAGAGARRELPFGATGMALLCQLDEAEQRAILQKPFKRFTDKTITDLDGYLNRLNRAAEEQLVVECGEYYDGIMAIAVPLPGRVPYTITVVGPEERVRPQQELITVQLRQVTAEWKRLDFAA